MRRLVLVLAGSLLLPASCSKNGDAAGPGDPGAGASAKTVATLLDETIAAADEGDWKKSLATAQLAASDPRATAEEKAQAWSARIRAEAEVNGDAGATAALAAMGQAGVLPSVAQFRDLGHDLAESGHATVALGVIDVATNQHGADPTVRKNLKKLAKFVEQKLSESGDSAGLDKLKSLGYLGGSDDEDEDEDAITKPTGGNN